MNDKTVAISIDTLLRAVKVDTQLEVSKDKGKYPDQIRITERIPLLDSAPLVNYYRIQPQTFLNQLLRYRDYELEAVTCEKLEIPMHPYVCKFLLAEEFNINTDHLRIKCFNPITLKGFLHEH